MSLGVVVITRNRRERALATLDRLRSLPERPPVVLVDNASSDGTGAAVRSGQPGVDLLTLRRNLGAAARNLGAARLGTDFVAFADDDSWWEPGACAEAARTLAARPRLGLVAAATWVGQDPPRPDPLNEWLAASPLGSDAGLPGPSVLGFLACAAVVRREAFLGVGGFHPLVGIGGEEALLAMDLHAAGWELVYCPAVRARHDPDPGPRPGRTAQLRRNALLTAVLRRPWPVVGRTAAALIRDAALRSPEAARALRAAAAVLPVALRERRPLPARTEAALARLERQARAAG
ncbi:glycosyltransferase family 2 protein [Streptacidiphilus monticola]|uniref:Glycosyltransferase family 2 protein n=1 Tax=Streptacidiphilus monticola TaxID=2161674 RepID=A0ABW1FZR5_9ACTN